VYMCLLALVCVCECVCVSMCLLALVCVGCFFWVISVICRSDFLCIFWWCVF
jgi:hypothetical protein